MIKAEHHSLKVSTDRLEKSYLRSDEAELCRNSMACFQIPERVQSKSSVQQSLFFTKLLPSIG